MDEFVFRDRAVYLPTTETLVLADLHIGRESTANVAMPLGEQEDLVGRLAGLQSAFEPTSVVFAGDLLDSFSTVPDGVAQTVDEIYRTCVDDGIEPVAIEGNHDRMLTSVWPGEIESVVKLDDGTVICHGHEEPDLRGERYLIGHDHPALTIEGVKRPCLCVDPTGYRDAELVVLPAFTRLAGGVELNHCRADSLLSPLIAATSSLRPIIWDADRETALEFPSLGEFRRLL